MESARLLLAIGVVLAFINTVSCQDEHLDIMPRFKVVSKAIGEKMALTCKPVVRDTSLITQIEWLDPKNRKIDSNSRNHMYLQNLPGDIGLMVVFPSLRAEHAGTYTCVAKYANSVDLRANVTVETYEDITFVSAPENQYPIINTDYTIKCEVKGNPSPTVDWYKNEVNIVTQERYIVVNGGLTIKNVRESDDGVYRCTAVVISTGQIKSTEIRVEVLIPPKIEPIPTVSVTEGESAIVKCKATGKPPPKYTWIKVGTSEDLRKADRFNVKEITGDLLISRVEFNDQSSYKCVAENEAGLAETSVDLKVLVKPRIFELINVTAPIHSETRIICKANGRPPPKVVFQKLSNKEPFEFGKQTKDKRINLDQTIITEKGESMSTLVISNLNRSDDGLYRCIAENKAGTAILNGHITVEFPPTFERTKNFPPTWTWGNRPGNISCIPEAIPNATIKWMHGGIEIRESPNYKIVGTSPRSNLIVYPGNEKRYYTTYECVATNKLGTDKKSFPLQEAFRPEMIRQVNPHSITATTIKFSVTGPIIEDGLPLRTITVQYKPERELTWDYARNHTWSFGAPYILEDLLPEVTYQFRFAARNDVGMGQWSNTETISMPRRSEPAEPKILLPAHSIIDDNTSSRQDMIAVSPYADRYDIRWNVPNSNGDPIIRYIIRYCKTEKINGEWRDSDCSEEIEQSVQYTHYELTNLFADTTYKVELRAQNAIGASSPAQIRIKTARGMDPLVPVESPTISSGAIIGIVLAAIVLVLLVVDIACFCVNRTGILATLCYRGGSKHDDEDQKLGSYKAAPAHPNSLNLPMPVKLIPTPTEETEPLKSSNQTNGETQLSVEYEGGKVYTKPGTITGKHSAV
ncbi:fasciclin-2 isoform X2 [Coccinella septempunctata]|uniref:fasciclin-2 isoform X2 n=1 Tax=Coccinella septempunctata TaxID=41139 RepID=UPI001D0666F9|nr:fasciclin-2 isoform X2 [Coccinella septempunctata]